MLLCSLEYSQSSRLHQASYAATSIGSCHCTRSMPSAARIRRTRYALLNASFILHSPCVINHSATRGPMMLRGLLHAMPIGGTSRLEASRVILVTVPKNDDCIILTHLVIRSAFRTIHDYSPSETRSSAEKDRMAFIEYSIAEVLCKGQAKEVVRNRE